MKDFIGFFLFLNYREKFYQNQHVKLKTLQNKRDQSGKINVKKLLQINLKFTI